MVRPDKNLRIVFSLLKLKDGFQDNSLQVIKYVLTCVQTGMIAGILRVLID